MGAWVAALMTYSFALSPRWTRLLASVFTVEAISDTLNLLYERAKSLEK